MTTESAPISAIESSIEIDAPPARVWEVVSEVRNAPQWSSQAVKVIALGGRTSAGTRAININRRGPLFWPTTSRVVEFEPGRRFANRIAENTTVWAFELEPTSSGGTRLTQRREVPHGLTLLSRFLTDRAFGGQKNFSRELDQGVSTSLQRIKALAERG
ncbi:SRPBCC family protein [Rhodococcus sp. IEGM 1408]|uniref:SRPBCC family protein n=1 Tax=Rhodococcus sp. IEGM 1408 TaxID=3082220 RepID=UPI0029554397|nr:SRPBCC family protein [Rhodococcus sp. IEGM 1408]MDV8001600.1 SRPBCC family protein [Rhodococcus sp. IEGM 1408]